MPMISKLPAALAAAMAMFAVAALGAESAAKGVRFDTPGVLDLSEPIAAAAGKPMAVAPAVATLGPEEAAKIFAARTQSENEPALRFSEDEYGCKPESATCAREHERTLLDAAGGAVKREGKRLTIVPASGAPAVFVDWKIAESKNADGDEEAHWYLGRMPGSGYQRVEVRFGHDSPGDFLVNPANGKVAFVHNGSDVAVPAPDGLHLVTFNASNPPFGLRVAALDAAGPRAALVCEAAKGADNISAQFKGWRDAATFDLAIEVRAARSRLAHRVAVRFMRGKDGWALAASDPHALEEIGFGCTIP
ncbi:MAG TPA: hypothetical protein VFB32_09215 [Rudaea sp.]|nr:hypothetical protein [Rudaea sp.]